MRPMKFYLDTHDHRSKTFPTGISKDQFATFFASYERSSREEGNVVLRAHVGLEDGRAYCFNMAPSADHVRRAHERAGLPFESITEVATATPGDLSLGALVPARARPHRALLRRGDVAGGAYLVVGGSLRVYYVSTEGREATLYTVEPGGTCVLALTATLNEEAHPAWVDAGPTGGDTSSFPRDSSASCSTMREPFGSSCLEPCPAASSISCALSRRSARIKSSSA